MDFDGPTVTEQSFDKSVFILCFKFSNFKIYVFLFCFVFLYFKMRSYETVLVVSALVAGFAVGLLPNVVETNDLVWLFFVNYFLKKSSFVSQYIRTIKLGY